MHPGAGVGGVEGISHPNGKIQAVRWRLTPKGTLYSNWHLVSQTQRKPNGLENRLL